MASLPNVHGIALSLEIYSQTESFSNALGTTAVAERCVFAIKWIRHELAKRGQHHAYAVVDNMPIELCHTARMYRVKRFQGIADIGLCASKK
ncbi:hypothetical protein HNQ34_002811 [Anoxybacillus tepidamans]|uniref:Uncharacterized protein n=1 Tax=Anoxybacteroides tepidamans TaxID=265948 RepID=A0A7W8MXJ9_9BACL|nr:hypothetical protein [Anoxybacillus tepidamans]